MPVDPGWRESSRACFHLVWVGHGLLGSEGGNSGKYGKCLAVGLLIRVSDKEDCFVWKGRKLEGKDWGELGK